MGFQNMRTSCESHHAPATSFSSIIRGVFLVQVIVLAPYGLYIQLHFLGAILVCAFMLHLFVQPYAHLACQKLETVSLFSSVATIWFGFLMQLDFELFQKVWVGYVIVAANLVFLVYGLYVLFFVISPVYAMLEQMEGHKSARLLHCLCEIFPKLCDCRIEGYVEHKRSHPFNICQHYHEKGKAVYQETSDAGFAKEMYNVRTLTPIEKEMYEDMRRSHGVHEDDAIHPKDMRRTVTKRQRFVPSSSAERGKRWIHHSGQVQTDDHGSD